MGCGNDANVYFSRAVFPDSFKLLFLQHLEKFGLKTDGYLGDFVQKERATVCNLNPSHPILVSTGESAFNMTEEFAFEQLIWDRGTVYLDERPLLSWTALMDGSGDQFLAGTGFAQDKTRRIGAGNELYLMQYLFQRCGLADDLSEVEDFFDFGLEILIF